MSNTRVQLGDTPQASAWKDAINFSIKAVHLAAEAKKKLDAMTDSGATGAAVYAPLVNELGLKLSDGTTASDSDAQTVYNLLVGFNAEFDANFLSDLDQAASRLLK